MDAVALSFLGIIVGTTLTIISGATVKRQFYYTYRFSTIIKKLREEALDIEDMDKDVKTKVEVAERDLRIISFTTRRWLEKAERLRVEIDGFLNQLPDIEHDWLAVMARHTYGMRARELTDRSKELRAQCSLDPDFISHPNPLVAADPVFEPVQEPVQEPVP